MRKILFAFAGLVFGNAWGQERPKLVVGIVVDQMKMEYLYRYADDFSTNGFKRLEKDGFVYQNMHYNYMPTYTGPGHASIYTGTTPAIHGIVGNTWYNKAIGKNQYCTSDETVYILGKGETEEGQMSPSLLQSTTVTDELRMATNFEGKVIGLSLKDRGAILPAGHFANWAFWYSNSGDFISSSFYGTELPQWVSKFNGEKHYLPYLQKKWNLLKPEAIYNESIADNNPYEGSLYNSVLPVFPYDLKDMFEKNGPEVIRTTPFGNELLVEFAKTAIEKEELGKDDITDFLAISFSSTDYVGHLTGPRSRELQDTYLRLDLTIADLLNYLDKHVGKENYLLFLTADHAAAENVDFLKDHKYAVEAVGYNNLKKKLEDFSMEAFGCNLVKNYSNFNLFLDEKLIEEIGFDIEKVNKSFRDFLMALPQVKRVYTANEIMFNSGNDYYLNCISRGFDPKQNGDLVILDKPGFMQQLGKGTTHGSPYSYDTHVPLLFYGWKVKKGESFDKKDITQIAPTIAQKIKIALPNSTEAKLLTEVLE